MQLQKESIQEGVCDLSSHVSSLLPDQSYQELKWTGPGKT